MSERMERCDKCKWWEIFEDTGTLSDNGTCHRYPPMCVGELTDMVRYGDGSEEAYWHQPQTYRDGFCGEFTPKDAPRTVQDS